VTVTPLSSLDLVRRFAEVRFEGVHLGADTLVGAPGVADADVEHQLQVALVLQLAELVGAAETVFDFTVDWAFNRYSFGRPLNSYQEIKHRMADLRTQREAAEAVAARAAFAVGTGTADAREWASAAIAYAGRVGPELVQDCIQLHGGIGVTADHDLHIFLRRATLDANLYGSPADFARRLGRLVALGEGVAA